MTTHTPTPWAIAPTHFGTPWNIEGPNGENIALVMQLTSPLVNPKQLDRHANTALIVERVNGWDALVEENANLKRQLNTASDVEGLLMAERDALKAALAKYGIHTDQCASLHGWSVNPKPCDCGFDTLLKVTP